MRIDHDPTRAAKSPARILRAELARRGAGLSRGGCLAIVAALTGRGDWNVLAAGLGGAAAAGISAEAGADRAPAPALARPAGWHVTGAKPHLYEVGIDPGARHRGKPALLIRHLGPGGTDPDPGFATLMQSVEAAPFRGRRASLSATLRTRAVAAGATLWLRVDGPGKQLLAFDNMEDRAQDGRLTGTQDRTGRRIVLDVAEAAESLNFGLSLRGPGEAWAAGFDVRVAEAGARATGRARFLAQPTNPDFTAPA